MPYAKIREKRLIFWRGYDILNSEYTKVANIQNSVAAVPVALSCLIMSLNFMPETLTALEGIPVFGSAVSAIDFRRWGFGWGDSEIRVEYPETGDDDADHPVRIFRNAQALSRLRFSPSDVHREHELRFGRAGV